MKECHDGIQNFRIPGMCEEASHWLPLTSVFCLYLVLTFCQRFFDWCYLDNAFRKSLEKNLSPYSGCSTQFEPILFRAFSFCMVFYFVFICIGFNLLYYHS